jgi:hypothetical protein
MKSGKIEQYAAPEELYERPATLFVAGFIGAPAMNFLPGIVRAGIVEIGDLRLPLSALPHHGTPADGASVILGVRPEHIGLAAGGAPGEQIDADTDFMEPMGADNAGLVHYRQPAPWLPSTRGVAGPTRLALDSAMPRCSMPTKPLLTPKETTMSDMISISSPAAASAVASSIPSPPPATEIEGIGSSRCRRGAESGGTRHEVTSCWPSCGASDVIDACRRPSAS